jgi:hypothetical protein
MIFLHSLTYTKILRYKVWVVRVRVIWVRVRGREGDEVRWPWVRDALRDGLGWGLDGLGWELGGLGW